MPTLPILAAAAALTMTRVSRWLGVLAVAGFAIAALTRVRAASELYRKGILGNQLPTLGGQPFIGLCVVLAIAGAVTLVGTLGWMAWTGGPAILDTNEEPATAK